MLTDKQKTKSTYVIVIVVTYSMLCVFKLKLILGSFKGAVAQLMGPCKEPPHLLLYFLQNITKCCACVDSSAEILADFGFLCFLNNKKGI